MLKTSTDQRKLLPNFEHLFATTAQAPGGVARLRELILTLAVQGKLVAQDPSDEPASELLKKIRAEKDRLMAEGKIKKEKPLAAIVEEEKPFELPVGWEWVRLPIVAPFRIGKTPPSKDPKYWSDVGAAWVSISDMNHLSGINKTNKNISQAGCDYFGYEPLPVGTLLMSFKLTIGKISVLEIPAYHNEAIISIYNLSGINTDFLKYILPAIAQAGGSKNALMGSTLNSESLTNLLLPLPPETEQSRIVTRVEELMRLCDALEEKGRLEHTQHQQLLQAMLDSLTQTTNAHELARHWQRLAQYFDLLIDRPEAVDALEQTILQLAVRGLLVPQDPSDEPANELLKKIRAEKDRLIAEGKIKKGKPLPAIEDEEIPFGLPDSWVWTRLVNLGESFDYGSSQKSVDDSSAVPILRMGNIQGGKILMSNLKYLRDSQDELPHLLLKKGDLLFNRTNSYELVGKTAIFEGFESDVTFASYLIRVRLLNQFMNSEYVNFYMNTQDFRLNEIEPDLTQQTGQANYNGTKLKNTRFPLPPLAEQSRIVARVTELRALCQQLREKLTQARTTQTQLAQAWVEQAAA